jgi:hypothetical protein
MINKRVRRTAMSLMAIAGVTLAVSQGASALASSGVGAAPRFHVIATTSRDTTLTSVVAPSSRSQWAFGGRELSKAMPPVALKRIGNRWTQAELPATAKGTIVCAGATSPSDVWAFEGEQFGPGVADTAAALQLRSGHWVVRHNFGDFFLTGCNVVSQTDVWAFGSTGAGPAIGTWHLHGSTWTHMTSSPAEYLGQASVVSGNNIWATGWDGKEGVLAHWNGSAWKADRSVLKALPKPSATVNVRVASVTALSSSSLWVEAVVGRENSQGEWHYGPVVVHYNGSRWTRVAASAYGYYLPAAVPDGHGGWWSAGYPALGPGTSSMTHVLHGSHGHWVKVGLPKARHGYLLNVTCIANARGSRIAYAVANEMSKSTGFSYGVILKVTY